jgi:hypothetical protein
MDRHYLGDMETIKKATESVARQLYKNKKEEG